MSRVTALLHSRWVTGGAVLFALVMAAGSWHMAPRAALLPAFVGLGCWTVGNYLLVPLRWHRLSRSGQSRRWHLRVYAEAEVLGLLSPAHAGTDLWRVHMLNKVGMDRASAVVDVASDRLVGGVGIVVVAALGGATLPPALLVMSVVAALIGLVLALVMRRRKKLVIAVPPKRALARGVAVSLVYQACAIGLMLGTVAAVGHSVTPMDMLGLVGASQIAALVPGVHGAGPKEGALATGLVSLGVPLSAAIGAITLAATLAWIPALVLGGASYVARRRSLRTAAVAVA